MEEITKEEYLEAVREGISDSFAEGIVSTYNLTEAIAEGVERAFKRTSKQAICNLIKEELMKGEKPWKS